tara:strand:+ start:93 stop:455 length:363 start_codon:yes stop_codon:yes gene_type:complete
MVARLSKRALQQIVAGKVKEPVTAVVKFYNNNCHYCYALQDGFKNVAAKYGEEGILFYAFNIQDYVEMERILNFTGVPTICLIKTGGLSPRIRVMPEPIAPNKNTWYEVPDIESFIEKEK